MGLAVLANPLIFLIGRRRARDITRRDVKDLLRKVLDRGGIMANRTLALIRKMFNYAVDELEIISVSPCLKIKAPAPENQRDRVLTAEVKYRPGLLRATFLQS